MLMRLDVDVSDACNHAQVFNWSVRRAQSDIAFRSGLGRNEGNLIDSIKMISWFVCDWMATKELMAIISQAEL